MGCLSFCKGSSPVKNAYYPNSLCRSLLLLLLLLCCCMLDSRRVQRRRLCGGDQIAAPRLEPLFPQEFCVFVYVRLCVAGNVLCSVIGAPSSALRAPPSVFVLRKQGRRAKKAAVPLFLSLPLLPL
jgi:hypothetical protein